ncbi:hypothetical protein DRE_02795 [Drechslerella stenobrocha 248]|uniref:Thioredoxin domain-containing protein n=1 Tax=Drechslerella stenobrocha 248 TaxID=1043628 RepID=W7I6N9_9PEZI|nr:hypothetical protein DRE_02795 [Drechslerella stenobrocha 248]
MGIPELKGDVKEFREFIAEGVTVVDFHAVWCGPCKQISPILEKLATEVETVKYLKVDVDEAPDVSAECGIRAMPTFMVFKDGEKVNELVAGKPVTPFEQPPDNAALTFVNNYGRIIVILLGLLIWYVKREPAEAGAKEFPAEL